MTLIHYFYRFTNVGLRGLTLLSKFCLLLFLAKYLDPVEVGLYGLLVATVAYGIYPLGFEFYTYSTREIIKTEGAQRVSVLRNQVALHIRLYFIAIPLFFLIFYFDLLPWHAAPWFFALVILEHACQEMMRLLVALEKQLVASIVLFVRQGSWALIVIALMLLDAKTRQLDVVLVGWVAGAAVAAVMSMLVLWRVLGIQEFWARAVDWRWVRTGLRVAIPFFLGTISLNFVTTVDKYWFNVLQGGEALGGYVFFMSISAAMMSFLEAGIFSFIYPSIIAAHHAGHAARFKSYLRKMLIQTVVLSVLFVVGVSLFIDWILTLLQREVYLGMKSVLYIFLLAMFFQALSYIPHYALYAQGRDRAIVGAHIFSVPIFIVTVALLVGWNDFYAVPVGGCVSYAAMLVYKYCAYRFTSCRSEAVRV